LKRNGFKAFPERSRRVPQTVENEWRALQAAEKHLSGCKKCQGTASKPSLTAKILFSGRKKRQGTASAVPQAQQNKPWALAPEVCFSAIWSFATGCLAAMPEKSPDHQGSLWNQLRFQETIGSKAVGIITRW
jgi:hypothetical protein